MDPQVTPPPPTVPPDAPDIPPVSATPASSKQPLKLLAILPIVAMVAALPFLAKSVQQRQLTGSQAKSPPCVATSGCPTSTPASPTPTTIPSIQAKFGGAAKFDGTTGFLKLATGNGISFNPAMGFTVETWIRPSQPTFFGKIIGRENGNQNSFNLAAQSELISTAHTYQMTYTFQVAEANLGCAMRSVQQTVPVPDTQSAFVTSWHHIAGVIQADGTLDIFVDGLRSTTNSNRLSQNCTVNLPVTVGARQFPGGTADGFFPGYMDELRVSNTARYSDNFIVPASFFTSDTQTLALYHLDENFLDATGSNPAAIPVGGVTFIGPASPTPTPRPTPTPKR